MKLTLTLVVLTIFNITILSAQNHKDCGDAKVLCDKSTYEILPESGVGEIDSAIMSTCVGFEYSSYWIALNVETAGDIVFDIVPAEQGMDLDFVVFKVEGSTKSVVRCMASGESVGQPSEECLGSTGLAYGETDIEENPGCSIGDNNYLAPIDAEAGDQYVLMINNFSQDSGVYEYTLGGTATYDCGETSTKEIDLTKSRFKSLTTLGHNSMTVELEASVSDATLSLYTLSGHKVYDMKVRGSDIVTIDRLPTSGVFLIVLKSSEFLESKKICILN